MVKQLQSPGPRLTADPRKFKSPRSDAGFGAGVKFCGGIAAAEVTEEKDVERGHSAKPVPAIHRRQAAANRNFFISISFVERSCA